MQKDTENSPRPDGAIDVVTMICPNLACRQAISAPVSARGTSVRCAHCHTPFRVPTESTAASVEPR
jgi:hypothetical protein